MLILWIEEYSFNHFGAHITNCHSFVTILAQILKIRGENVPILLDIWIAKNPFNEYDLSLFLTDFGWFLQFGIEGYYCITIVAQFSDRKLTNLISIVGWCHGIILKRLRLNSQFFNFHPASPMFHNEYFSLKLAEKIIALNKSN